MQTTEGQVATEGSVLGIGHVGEEDELEEEEGAGASSLIHSHG